MARSREWIWGTLCALLVTTLIAWAPRARADEPEPGAAAAEEAPDDQAAPHLPWQLGPLHTELGHELSLDLNDHYMFLARDPAVKLLERMGNFYNDGVLGLATSTDVAGEWFVVIRYDEEGHVKDDEQIDADDLLEGLRGGVDEVNAQRKEHGFQALALDGWAEPPRYDASLHHLVWGLIVSDAGGKSVNYNTRVLGRRGYASLNLVTDPDKLAGFKPEAAVLLSGAHFAVGSRYEDFDAKSDKTAEYGLAGLIAAGAGLGAAKLVKIGLIAKFWKLAVAALIAGKKLVVLALAGAAAYLKKLFGARKKSESAG
jgi:uncharacterized membrane-anchored protein